MRIWIIAENWPPRIGGIERYLTGIAEGLGGYELTVIAPLLSHPLQLPLGQGERTTRLPLLSKEGLGEVSVIRKRFFWPMWPKWLPLYLFLLTKARAEKPDLIICGKALVEGRLAEKLKKKIGIPYVVCTYGMEIATWIESQRTREQLQRVLRHANAVLYINERTKGELLALGVPPKVFHVLYPCIDTAKLSSTSSSEEIGKKYNVSAPYIISVARLVKRKGMDDLINAFAGLGSDPLPSPMAGCSPLSKGEKKRLRLLIVGDGPERASLESLAKRLNANVLFLGQIPDEELYALYAKAIAFALTPKELAHDYEGFGIVYLEAAFFGLPIIATKTGGVEKAVLDLKTGILAEPGNSASIQVALQKILSDPILARRYGKSGEERAKREFSKEQFAVQVKEIIDHI